MERPNLGKALKYKLHIKCKVDRNTSESVQKFCIDNFDYFWLTGKGILHLDEEYLFIRDSYFTCSSEETIFYIRDSIEYFPETDTFSENLALYLLRRN